MDERDALSLLAAELGPAGDDAAVVDGQVLTTDMLHERTDFPEGTTRYTAGWRAVGASLSDVAAMGAEATAAVAAYGAPAFDREELADFVAGASDVCELVGARYVGGDLDAHGEFTVATTALGRAGSVDPVPRSGATPSDVVCVTGQLGRSAAALELFERGERERANELFRFEPRIEAGRALAPRATAMMDSSDGLARSLHQLAEASDCGFAIDAAAIPVADALQELSGGPENGEAGNAIGDDGESGRATRDDGGTVGATGDGGEGGTTIGADGADEALATAIEFGEDFELVATVPASAVDALLAATTVPLAVIGDVVEAPSGVTLDGEPLADRGYTHG